MFKKLKDFISKFIQKEFEKDIIQTSSIMIFLCSFILFLVFGYAGLNLKVLDFIIDFLSSNFIIFAGIIISSFIAVLSYNRKEYFLEDENMIISFKVFLFLTYFLIFSSLILKFIGREYFPSFIQLYIISILVSVFLLSFFLFWIFLFSLTDSILPQKIISNKLKQKKINETILNIIKYTIKNNDDNLLELICKKINNFFIEETKNRIKKKQLIELIRKINNFYTRSHKYNYLYGNEFLGEILFKYNFYFYQSIIIKYDFKEDIEFQNISPPKGLNFDETNHIKELQDKNWLKLKKYYENQFIIILDILENNYNYSNFKYWFSQYINFFNPNKYVNVYSAEFIDISFEKIIFNINKYYSDKDLSNFLNLFNIFSNFYIRYLKKLKMDKKLDRYEVFFHIRIMDKVKNFLYSVIKRTKIKKYEVESFKNMISFFSEVSNIIPINNIQFNLPFLLIELEKYLDEHKNEINQYEYLASICFMNYEEVMNNIIEGNDINKLKVIAISLQKRNRDKYYILFRELIFNAYLKFLTGELFIENSPLVNIKYFIELYDSKEEVIKKIENLNINDDSQRIIEKALYIINNNKNLF